MPDEQPFYHVLADVYDLLFPVTAGQRCFFADLVNEHHVARALDVACGSGGQAAMFRDLGLEVSALEYDAKMIELVRARGREIDVRGGSMADVASVFGPGFGMVICIGNSLPHLADLDEVRGAVDGMRSLLRPGGVLVLSIVNYDHVVRERITHLPRKEVQDAQGRAIVFERFYDLSALPRTITFSTKLTVEGAAREASVPLLPISPEWLTSAVAGAGLTVVGRFAGFSRTPFGDKSMSLVLVARHP